MMIRRVLLVLLALVLSATALAANTKVFLNGQPVTLPVMDVDGKAFVDVVALMKLLGGKCTFDAAAGKLWINSGAAPPAAGGAGGGAATGTPQLPGDKGALGQVYTISKANPLYFRLVSAEFTVAQVVIGDDIYAPKADEKLLLLHFTVQNPDKTAERMARYDCLRFTAFDAMNVGHPGERDWGDDENHQSVRMDLKPAQTVSAYSVIRVPAKGPITKLMIQPREDNDGPVLRYMFTDQINPLQPPFADPADATGYTALTTVPAEIGTPYPYQNFTITLEKFEYSTEPMKETPPGKGGRYLVVTLLIHISSPRETQVRYDFLSPTLTTPVGEELKYGGMVTASSGRAFGQMVKGGAEVRVRLYFTVPKDITPNTLTLKEGDDSRTYEYQVPQ
jgi:hypothetical protein